MLLISSILFANEKNLLIYTATVAEIRSAMSVNADANIGSMMKMKANLQWIGIRKNFSNSQVKDFFMGALQLSQNSDKDISIQALYNPWLDSMLLMKLSISENKAIVDDIMILSGETFRNEKYLPTNVEKMLSTKEPLVVSLWRNVDSTRRIFEEKFKTVEDSNSVYSSYKIADKNEEKHLVSIQRAAALHSCGHRLGIDLYRAGRRKRDGQTLHLQRNPYAARLGHSVFYFVFVKTQKQKGESPCSREEKNASFGRCGLRRFALCRRQFSAGGLYCGDTGR